MKFHPVIFAASDSADDPRTTRADRQLTCRPAGQAAFTMVEIAICLAIIGIALVGIIGVLPIGMNTQRDTREETIVNEDVATLLPIISHGMRGSDDLTNYVYAITNYQGLYGAQGLIRVNVYGYTYAASSGLGSPNSLLLTNGLNIVGLLSTPEYENSFTFQPLPNVVDGGYSNHIVAYVRSMSGLAAEKPPQKNDIMVNDAFTYRMTVVNAPVALDTNNLTTYNSAYYYQLWQNQHEMLLNFHYPQLPNGGVGRKQLTFRATVAGQLALTNVNGQHLYFYQPQSFGVNTN